MAWSFTLPVVRPRGFSPSSADKALKAEQQAAYVRDLWILIASVVAFLAVIRFTRLFFSIIFKHTNVSSKNILSTEKGPEDVQPGRTGKISLRRIPAALASGFKVVAFRLNIPIGPGDVATVTELLFIFGYIITIFILLLVDTEGLNDWFFEDRAAHFASCQLPLIVALAGKNNIISFLTGIGHEKLNVLHRAAARVCLILLWMHAICRITGGLPAKFDFSHGWMRWGLAGLIAFTLATILSLRPIRNMVFEFFLVSHIILIAIFLVGGYIHARDPGFGDYIWPALVVWAFDRVLRFTRLLWNNRMRFSGQHSGSVATVDLLSEDTVRLTLRRRMNWRPGQHAYVILPSVSELPTEAHPFTIASIPQALDGTCGPDEKDVVFLIRGRSGFTGRLRDQAAANGNHTVPAFIDGPYGCPPNLTGFSTCVLIAGGSGVSFTLPLLLDLVHKARANKSSAKKIVFVWAVRDSEHLKWISKLLTEALAAARNTQLTIDPRIYITGPKCPIPEVPSLDYADNSGSSTPMSPISEKSSDEKAGLPIYSALKISHGRPSISRILQDEISTALGSVSVSVAGPTPLSQAVSRVLSSGITSPVSVMKGAPSVSLFVETFGMVH
ncbi:ferric reductase NAD binding domain-containing protein [Abortiporus biennis]|nr:ferric reductase NAD binding domain-containing protein [Abortiporus biennis]